VTKTRISHFQSVLGNLQEKGTITFAVTFVVVSVVLATYKYACKTVFIRIDDTRFEQFVA
jgi:type III secretory pathway component EscS